MDKKKIKTALKNTGIGAGMAVAFAGGFGANEFDKQAQLDERDATIASHEIVIDSLSQGVDVIAADFTQQLKEKDDMLAVRTEAEKQLKSEVNQLEGEVVDLQREGVVARLEKAETEKELVNTWDKLNNSNRFAYGAFREGLAFGIHYDKLNPNNDPKVIDKYFGAFLQYYKDSYHKDEEDFFITK